jgi:hypothetical protein
MDGVQRIVGPRATGTMPHDLAPDHWGEGRHDNRSKVPSSRVCLCRGWHGFGCLHGASKDHRLFIAHAHILLVGFVVSFIYALIHKLWLVGAAGRLAGFQFYLHQIAALVMLSGLVLLFSGMVAEATLGPVLGMATVGVLLAMVLMA